MESSWVHAQQIIQLNTSGNGISTNPGEIHYFGGFALDGIRSEVWKITVGHGPAIVSVVGNLPHQVYEASAAWDQEDNVFIFGGYTTTGVSSWIIQYTISNNEAELLAARLPGPRYTSAAVWSPIDKNFYIFGGSEVAAAGPYLDDIVRFNPATHTVTKLDVKLPKKSGFSCAFFNGGSIYYIGGFSGLSPFKTLVVRFDPVTLQLEQLFLDNDTEYGLFDPSCALVEGLNRTYFPFGNNMAYIQL